MPTHETSPMKHLLSLPVHLLSFPTLPSVSSVSDDVVQPHSSPSTKIVIDLNTYSNAESLGQENSSKKVCIHEVHVHTLYSILWITLNLFHAESPT